MSSLAQTRQAYTEIDNFIDLLKEEERNRIPIKLRIFFKQEKDNNYNKRIDANRPIKEQELKEETLDLIAILNLKYICQNENEKSNLQRIYQENENKYQAELKEKYNPDNLFKNKISATIQKTDISNENVAMVEYKESIFKKFINKIKNFFRK